MSPRTLRARLLDLAVTTVCVACVAAPLLPIVHAADPGPAIQESGTNVDQKVLEAGTISNPLNGSFDSATSGVANGSIQWDVYSTARIGMKLLVSSDRAPALRDPQHGLDIADQAATPAAWSVADGERRFGFTAKGSMTLDRFDGGSNWRGFDGTRPVEVARRTSTIPQTRTTINLRGEYDAALPSGARPAATVIATAVPNL